MCVRKILPLTFLLLTQLFLAACEHSTPEQLVVKAEQAYSDGKIKSAILHLKNALQHQPNNPRARWLLSEIYLDIGDGASAEKELLRARGLGVSEDAVLPSIAKALLLKNEVERVKALTPESPLSSSSAGELAAAKAIAAAEQGQHKESSEFLRDAKRLNPNGQYVVFAEAVVSFAQSDKEGALEKLEQSLGLNSRFAPAWALKGDVYREQQEYESAADAYSEAIKLKASPTNELIWRGLMRVALRDFVGAQADAELALRAAAKSPEALYLSGLLAYYKKEFDRAQDFLERAHSADARHFQTRVLLAATDLRLGNSSRATRLAESAVVQRPGYIPIRKLLAVLYLQNRDGVRAEEMLRPIVDRRADDLDAKNMLAASLMIQGRPEDADPFLSEVAERRSQSPMAQFRHGLGKIKAGDSDSGIRLLRDAAELAPEDPLIQTALVSELVKREAIEDAVETAQRFAGTTKGATGYVLLANAYLAGNQKAEAEKALQRALQVENGYRTASIQLSGMMVDRGDLESARQVLEHSLQAYPGDAKLMMRLAALYDRMEQSDKAKNMLLKAAEANKDLIAPRVLLARDLLANGRPDSALAMLSSTEGLRNDPIGLMVRADVYTALNRIGDARFDLERLAELMPESAEVRYRLGVASDAMADIIGARKAIESALQLDPNHESAQLAQARLLALEGRTDEANEFLARSDADPQSFDYLAARVFVSRLAGDHRSEVNHARDLHQGFPSSDSALRLSEAFERNGSIVDAIIVLKTWFQSNKREITLLSALARLYHKLGSEKDLIDTLEAILRIDRNNVQALNNLAWQMRKRDPGKALSLASEAYKLDAGRLAVVDTYLTILMETERYRQALSIADAAIELSHPSQDYLVTKAEILSLMGLASEAVSILRSIRIEGLSPERREIAMALMESGR